MRGFIEVTVEVTVKDLKFNTPNQKLINVNSIQSIQREYIQGYPEINSLIVLNDCSGTCVRCKESYEEIKKAILEAST